MVHRLLFRPRIFCPCTLALREIRVQSLIWLFPAVLSFRNFPVCYVGIFWIILRLFLIFIITVIILLLLLLLLLSCQRLSLSGTSLEPMIIPTVQASSFRLQYFPCYVWFSQYICLCNESIELWHGFHTFKQSVTIPIPPFITGAIIHFLFHIRCISIHKH